MPPKDSATEMIYKILDNVTGVSFNYDTKTGLTYATEPKTAIYDKVTAVDNCYVSCAIDHKCSQCENWKEKEEKAMKNSPKPAPVYGPFEVRSVLSNRKKNAFSVVWMDGTTTVVHCQTGDDWDDEKALAMCFTKKALGNKGNFNDKFNDALDNKMKVIPEEKKVVLAKFVHAKEDCNCDGTRTECKCKEETKADETFTEAVEKLKNSANIATSSLKDMIDELVGNDKHTKKPEPAKTYRIFVCSALNGEKKMHLATRHSVQEVRDFVKEYGKEAGHGWYFRTWNTDGGMYIDYGSYTNYLLVEGMDNSEYVKK